MRLNGPLTQLRRKALPKMSFNYSDGLRRTERQFQPLKSRGNEMFTVNGALSSAPALFNIDSMTQICKYEEKRQLPAP